MGYYDHTVAEGELNLVEKVRCRTGLLVPEGHPRRSHPVSKSGRHTRHDEAGLLPQNHRFQQLAQRRLQQRGRFCWVHLLQ